MGWVVKAENPWKAPDNFSSDSKRLIQQLENALRIQGKEFSPEALDALRLGDVDGFLQAIDFQSLIVPQEKISSVLYDQAKNAGIKTFSDAGIDAKILFDAIDRRAVDYALNASSLLITNISDEIRTNVRQTIATALNGGLTLPQVASRIRTDLPLTARDAGAVDNFRQKQYEKFMRSGMPEGKARDKAEARAERYSQKLTRQRAKTIARTEIVNASNQGRYMGWEEGVINGYVDSSSKKEWIAEPDACPDCLPLDGEMVLWNEPFSSGDEMPPFHPNCRCSSALVPPDYTDSPFNAIPNEAPEFDQQALSVNPDTGETSPLAGGNENLEAIASLDAELQPLEALWAQEDIPDKWGSGLREETRRKFWIADRRTIYFQDKNFSDLEIQIAETRLQGFRKVRSSGDLEKLLAELPKADQKRIRNILDRADALVSDGRVVMNVTSEVLEQVIADGGEFKNQFQTGTSRGLLSTKDRTRVEAIAMNIPIDALPEQRPVYGFIANNANAPHRQPTVGAVLTDAQSKKTWETVGSLQNPFPSSYGELSIVFKTDVANRTTITFGDSLAEVNTQRPVFAPILANAERNDLLYGGLDNQIIISEGRTQIGQTIKPLLYLEAQIKNVSLSDVDEIWVVQSSAVAKLRKTLDDAGYSGIKIKVKGVDDFVPASKASVKAEALEQFQQKAGFTVDSLTSEEVNALQRFKQTDYGAINTVRRFSKDEALKFMDEAEYRKYSAMADAIESAIKKAPELPEDLVVGRVVLMDYAKQLKTLDVGETFIENGFSSTTTLAEVVEGRWQGAKVRDGVKLEITYPKGSKGIFLDELLGKRTSRGEGEWLPQGGYRYKVIGKKKDTIILQAEAIPESRIDLPKLLDTASTNAERTEAFQKLFKGQDFAGFSVEPYSVYQTQGGLLSVKCKIRDADGNYAGDVERKYSRDDDGRLIVEHELFTIEKPYRGRGFSTSFSKFSEDLYKEMGVAEIHLEASLKDGSYTWAKAGYEWKDKPLQLVRELRERINDSKDLLGEDKWTEMTLLVYKLERGAIDDADYPTPFELANLKGPEIEDKPFGKWLLAGTTWVGRKKLG